MSRERGPVENLKGDTITKDTSWVDIEMQSGWIQAPREQWDEPQIVVEAGVG